MRLGDKVFYNGGAFKMMLEVYAFGSEVVILRGPGRRISDPKFMVPRGRIESVAGALVLSSDIDLFAREFRMSSSGGRVVSS